MNNNQKVIAEADDERNLLRKNWDLFSAVSKNPQKVALKDFIYETKAGKVLQINFNFRWQFKGSHQGCSMKKVFLKISQYSQESIIVGVSF